MYGLEKTLSDITLKMVYLEDELKEMKHAMVRKELTNEKDQQSKKTKDTLDVTGISKKIEDKKEACKENDIMKDSKEKRLN